MTDIKICIGGSVDAGKSTTIGVLSKNVNDDGRGYARSLILKSKHELETAELHKSPLIILSTMMLINMLH
jgi:GTPase